MAQQSDKAPRRGRIVLDQFEADRERPRLALHAVDDTGGVIETVSVDEEGSFPVTGAFGEKAARVLIGPADASADARRTFYALPADEFRSLVKAGTEIAIAGRVWQRWFFFRRCVSGTVRRCFPFGFVIDDLIVSRRLDALAAVRRVAGLRPLAPFPFVRCSPVCFGTVEVYRRVCCCTPPPWFEPPLRIPEFPPDFPFPPVGPVDPFGPIGPPGPWPGPDPAPLDLQQLVLTEGAIDEGKIARLHAAEMPASLPAELRQAFYLRHPFLWCHCGVPVKVGQGFVQDGGAFSVCWRAPIILPAPNCREEFAYIVKQPIGGVMVTIYNGVAANQWFPASQQPTLTSYHPFAVGCRHTDVPGDGAFVVLQDIGATPSHQLAKPPQTSFESVGSLLYNSGLLNPVANAADAAGQLLNRNLGGRVALRYHFTESMRPAGAIFYRISVARASASGTPIGPWTPLPAPTWKTWKLGTASEGTIPLGPHPAGGETGLSKIPYDTGDPLGPNEEWQDGQFHGVIDTTNLPNGRHLVMIEVFNAAGARLKPAAAPSTEAGTVAPFTFRRWDSPASTVPVSFAGLTHMFWWDNRPAVARIADIRLNGATSSEQCQFLEASAGAVVQIGYRAYHPQPGTPSFLHRHSLRIRRGLGGPSWQVANLPPDEVGETGPPHTSVPRTLGDLLGDRPAGHQKCAFAVNLHAHVKTTNGAGTLTNLDAHDTAAFAAEIV
jgi:hypothetical protein